MERRESASGAQPWEQVALTRQNPEGVALDHIHILCRLSRKVAIMDVLKVSKTETSKWLKKQDLALKGFNWRGGYGIFSVSQSNVEQVKGYIANQAEHHKG